MSQFKKAQVVMLPTDKEPVKGDLLLRHLWKNEPKLECNSLWQYKETVIIDNVKQYNTLNSSFRDHYKSFKTQNIYIISDGEIKQEDWVLFSFHRKDGMLFKFIEKNNAGSSKLYNPITKKEEWYGDMFSYKKIIATTDTSLKIWDHTCFSGEEMYKKLPQIPQQFIEDYIETYNEGNTIKDVLVEYTVNNCFGECGICDNSCGQKLKINPENNSINIKNL